MSYNLFKQKNLSFVCHILIDLALPHILPFTFGDESINEGETVAVQCVTSKGDLPIRITWLHNGQAIIEDEGLHVIKTSSRISTLNFEYVRAHHRGNYTCLAKNSAGAAEFTTDFYINGLDFLSEF